jgi:rubredoxin
MINDTKPDLDLEVAMICSLCGWTGLLSQVKRFSFNKTKAGVKVANDDSVNWICPNCKSWVKDEGE